MSALSGVFIGGACFVATITQEIPKQGAVYLAYSLGVLIGWLIAREELKNG